ncbi:hypothetical protein RHMOL_Rhmol06G0323600 [Rhododendron molle]|uniref:Uncharacterized protein n=1 Tax=Rhododendron molle TaxID=49168 RepID=A0ACC0NJ01_RHOML|nr:hypothetical protein RHMOL_Rhmol06G0323600 [Rhododendron molle]
MGEHDFLPDPGMPRLCKSGDKERVFVDSTFGFGYNASTREYKVVGFRKRIYESATNRRYRLHAKVITMGKKGCQWSEIDKPFLCPLHSSDIVVGNAIHWFCKEEEEEDWFRGAILSFDLSEEKFHQIPNPDCKISRHYSYLSVLGGCLVLTNDFFVWDRWGRSSSYMDVEGIWREGVLDKRICDRRQFPCIIAKLWNDPSSVSFEKWQDCDNLRG